MFPIKTALDRLGLLKTELADIEETLEEQLQGISTHVLALEEILKGTKKSKITFSAVTEDDLKKVGVVRKRLRFRSVKIAALADGLTKDALTIIEDLHSRMKKIYSHVNMDYEPGCRILLDAILLALAEISTTTQRFIAILPEMRIGRGTGIQISHPSSGHELWLSGSVDYAVIEHEDIDNDHQARLLEPGGSRVDALEISKGCLFLVVAKHMSPDRGLASHIPEAVSQAIVLLKSTNFPEVRFCLSDGRAWIFFILRLENEILTYYESPARSLDRHDLVASDLQLREIVQLVREWLKPTMTDLFVLE